MNVNLQQCQFVKTRVRLVKYTCIFVETPQSSRSIYKGDFIRGVTTIRGNKRIVRACYTVQRFCNLQQRARVTPRSKLLFRSLCTLVFMFNLPECEVKLKPNGLASRRKSTHVCGKTRTCVRTCAGWPNDKTCVQTTQASFSFQFIASYVVVQYGEIGR